MIIFCFLLHQNTENFKEFFETITHMKFELQGQGSPDELVSFSGHYYALGANHMCFYKENQIRQLVKKSVSTMKATSKLN